MVTFGIAPNLLLTSLAPEATVIVVPDTKEAPLETTSVPASTRMFFASIDPASVTVPASDFLSVPTEPPYIGARSVHDTPEGA